MIRNFIENIGLKTINFLISTYDIFQFFVKCIFNIFSTNSYNKTTIKQIYYTSITILPLFITITFFIGFVINAIIISLASQYSLQDNVGSILFIFIIEFAPLFITFLIALRSGIVINTKIALMKSSGKLDSLISKNINIFHTIIAPKIISSIVSVLSLTILFVFIFFISGYIFTMYNMHMDTYNYSFLLFNAIEMKTILFLVVKTIIFGFISMSIPIYYGLQTTSDDKSIPIYVSKGIIRLFIVLFVFELLSLLIIL